MGLGWETGPAKPSSREPVGDGPLVIKSFQRSCRSVYGKQLGPVGPLPVGLITGPEVRRVRRVAAPAAPLARSHRPPGPSSPNGRPQTPGPSVSNRGASGAAAALPLSHQSGPTGGFKGSGQSRPCTAAMAGTQAWLLPLVSVRLQAQGQGASAGLPTSSRGHGVHATPRCPLPAPGPARRPARLSGPCGSSLPGFCSAWTSQAGGAGMCAGGHRPPRCCVT